MKILEKEIILKEHLYDGHIYCINFEKKQLALFENNEFHLPYQNNKIKSIPYEKAQVFAYCSEYKADNLNNINSNQNLAIYEVAKIDLLKKRTKYTAGFLNISDQNKLIKLLKDKLPENWDIVCHHMTLNLGECKEEFSSFLNTKQKLTCVAFGIDLELEVAAIKVDSILPSTNQTKHITFAVGKNGKPFNSNKINNYIELNQPIECEVDIGMFLNDKTILIKKNKLKKPSL